MRNTGIRVTFFALTGVLALAACSESGGGSANNIPLPDGGGGAGGSIGPGGTGGTGGSTGGTVEPDLGTGGAIPPDANLPDANPNLECPAATGYGIIAAPVAVTAGAKASHTPRAVWSGSEFAMVWFAAGEEELGSVKFQRFSTEGAPVGTEQDLGLAKVARYDVVSTGSGYLAAFIGARDIAGNGFEGVRIVTLSADGEPVGSPTDLEATFDAERISVGFAPLTGGMVLFSRGLNGSGGLFAQPLDEAGGETGDLQTLSVTPANYPAVAFGNGSWGASWTDPTSATPSDVVFKLLNDHAVPIATANLPAGAGAKGAVYLTYGGGDSFGLAWSKMDEVSSLRPKLTLLSATDAMVEVSPDVQGPSGFGVVADLAWHDPDFFGVAWQDNDNGRQRVGLTRINPQGVALEPFAIEPPTGATATGLSVAGTVSNLGAFYTLDPTPSPTGFSDQAQVYLARLGACR